MIALEFAEGAKGLATFVGILVGLAGLFAFLWAAGKVQGTEKTIELLTSGLDAINATLERERHERELENAEALRRAEERDRSCTARITELEARLELVTSGFVERVGISIVDAVRDELRKTPNPGAPS